MMPGWLSGLLGVIIFSGSLPATRVAVAGLPPIFLTSARAAIAALLAAVLLFAVRSRRPGRGDILSLAIVALGVVVGFPMLTAMALQHMTAAHATVFIGLLPLFTAVFGVLRGGERPRLAFWLFSVMGSVTVAAFAVSTSTDGLSPSDLLMLGAVVVCGLGYAEGALLSRRLGGWQVISWALLLSLPLMATIALATMPMAWRPIQASAWIGLGYVSIFSMLVGFVFWFRGLALGGIATVSQFQLLQPFIGLLLAAALLHEHVAWAMIASTAVVVLCVAGARRYAA